MNARHWLKEGIKVSLLVLFMFISAGVITIAMMAVYNWFNPVDWSKHHREVVYLFYGVLAANSVLFLFQPRRS